MEEQIYAVPRAAMFGGAWPHGFVPRARLGADPVAALESRARPVPRPAAEADPGLKQLIPYCLVLGPGALFCARRLPRQGESRLHGRLSVGFGGHVDAGDGPMPGAVRRALARELHEELLLPGELSEPRFLGLLNDDETEVGQVHVGLVFALVVPRPGAASVAVRETHKMEGAFLPLQEPQEGRGGAPGRVVDPAIVWQDPAPFESWSAIVLEARPWFRSTDGLHSGKGRQ